MTDNNSHDIPRRQILQTSSVLFAAGFAGCLDSVPNPFSSPPPIDQVSIRFQDIRAPSFGATTITLPILLEISNQAQEPVPDPALEADIYISDSQVATSEATANTLSAGETATIQLDVIIQATDISQSIANSIQSGEFTVQIEGALSSEGSFKSVSISSQTG